MVTCGGKKRIQIPWSYRNCLRWGLETELGYLLTTIAMAGLEFTIFLPHPPEYYNSFILLRKKTKLHQQQKGRNTTHTKDVCSTKIEESTSDFPPWKSYG